MMYSAFSKKIVIVIRHVAFEDLGTLGPVLSKRHYDVRYFEAGIQLPALSEVKQADLLVVLGGPIGAYEIDDYPFLADTFQVIHERIRTGKPMIGVCLGAQLIAKALGAEVLPMKAGKEIGFSTLELTPDGEKSALGLIGNQTHVLHWHGDQFAIPEQAELLAKTAHCPNQAFSIGNSILCLQFHLEFDAASIERWLIGHASELHSANINIPTLRDQAKLHGGALAKASQKVFDVWLDKAEQNNP